MALDASIKHFFESELDDYRENVRNGNIDPSDGFHPTLASAIDTLMQAPDDEMMFGWFWIDVDEEDTDPGSLLAHCILQLANLVCEHGPDAKLVDLI